MGIVFRAVRDDGETVALKVLKPAYTDDDSYERRFRREARVASEVRHRHLVPVLDAGEVGGRRYLTVAYVPGVSLKARLATERTLSLDASLLLVAEVGSGLDALHRHGLVHRDVKPSNILLDEEGAAALTDFGLAKGPDDSALTETGMVVGTIDYLAPELIAGGEATPASDIYALGCVAYECLAGSPPFATENVLEAIAAHLDAEPQDVSRERRDVPLALGAALLRALAKKPDERPRTARAYVHMLAVSARAG
jgi:serine/threonine protein kinase